MVYQCTPTPTWRMGFGEHGSPWLGRGVCGSEGAVGEIGVVHSSSERVQKAGGEKEGDTGVSQTSLVLSEPRAAGLTLTSSSVK